MVFIDAAANPFTGPPSDAVLYGPIVYVGGNIVFLDPSLEAYEEICNLAFDPSYQCGIVSKFDTAYCFYIDNDDSIAIAMADLPYYKSFYEAQYPIEHPNYVSEAVYQALAPCFEVSSWTTNIVCNRDCANAPSCFTPITNTDVECNAIPYLTTPVFYKELLDSTLCDNIPTVEEVLASDTLTQCQKCNKLPLNYTAAAFMDLENPLYAFDVRYINNNTDRLQINYWIPNFDTVLLGDDLLTQPGWFYTNFTQTFPPVDFAPIYTPGCKIEFELVHPSPIYDGLNNPIQPYRLTPADALRFGEFRNIPHGNDVPYLGTYWIQGFAKVELLDLSNSLMHLENRLGGDDDDDDDDDGRLLIPCLPLEGDTFHPQCGLGRVNVEAQVDCFYPELNVTFPRDSTLCYWELIRRYKDQDDNQLQQDPILGHNISFALHHLENELSQLQTDYCVSYGIQNDCMNSPTRGQVFRYECQHFGTNTWSQEACKDDTFCPYQSCEIRPAHRKQLLQRQLDDVVLSTGDEKQITKLRKQIDEYQDVFMPDFVQFFGPDGLVQQEPDGPIASYQMKRKTRCKMILNEQLDIGVAVPKHLCSSTSIVSSPERLPFYTCPVQVDAFIIQSDGVEVQHNILAQKQHQQQEEKQNLSFSKLFQTMSPIYKTSSFNIEVQSIEGAQCCLGFLQGPKCQDPPTFNDIKIYIARDRTTPVNILNQTITSEFQIVNDDRMAPGREISGEFDLVWNLTSAEDKFVYIYVNAYTTTPENQNIPQRLTLFPALLDLRAGVEEYSRFAVKQEFFYKIFNMEKMPFKFTDITHISFTLVSAASFQQQSDIYPVVWGCYMACNEDYGKCNIETGKCDCTAGYSTGSNCYFSMCEQREAKIDQLTWARWVLWEKSGLNNNGTGTVQDSNFYPCGAAHIDRDVHLLPPYRRVNPDINACILQFKTNGTIYNSTEHGINTPSNDLQPICQCHNISYTPASIAPEDFYPLTTLQDDTNQFPTKVKTQQCNIWEPCQSVFEQPCQNGGFRGVDLSMTSHIAICNAKCTCPKGFSGDYCEQRDTCKNKLECGSGSANPECTQCICPVVPSGQIFWSQLTTLYDLIEVNKNIIPQVELNLITPPNQINNLTYFGPKCEYFRAMKAGIVLPKSPFESYKEKYNIDDNDENIENLFSIELWHIGLLQDMMSDTALTEQDLVLGSAGIDALGQYVIKYNIVGKIKQTVLFNEKDHYNGAVLAEVVPSDEEDYHDEAAMVEDLNHVYNGVQQFVIKRTNIISTINKYKILLNKYNITIPKEYEVWGKPEDRDDDDIALNVNNKNGNIFGTLSTTQTADSMKSTITPEMAHRITLQLAQTRRSSSSSSKRFNNNRQGSSTKQQQKQQKYTHITYALNTLANEQATPLPSSSTDVTTNGNSLFQQWLAFQRQQEQREKEKQQNPSYNATTSGGYTENGLPLDIYKGKNDTVHVEYPTEQECGLLYCPPGVKRTKDDNNTGLIVVAIIIPIVIGAAFIGFLISLYICKQNQTYFFKPKPAKTAKAKTKTKSTDTELTATSKTTSAVGSTTFSTAATGIVVNDDEILPDGWRKMQEPTSGKLYYYNSTTMTTKWNNPAEPEPQESEFGW